MKNLNKMMMENTSIDSQDYDYTDIRNRKQHFADLLGELKIVRNTLNRLNENNINGADDDYIENVEYTDLGTINQKIGAFITSNIENIDIVINK